MTSVCKRILLVDDDRDLLRLLSMRLNAVGFEVKAAQGSAEALAQFPLFHPHVVITDLRMDELDGLALFDSVHKHHPTLPFIIMTAHGTIHEAVEATRRGIFGFLTKPVDSKELINLVEKALKISGQSIRNEKESETWRSRILTNSPVMEDLLAQAQRIAQTDASVLLQGESGTGKELLARAVHDAGPRCDRPFVAVNCNAIPENLFESELFGHRKGAFTGATQNYPGLFCAAHRGTLFLDEIGDMPPVLQVKLLRVLQERRVRAVGASEDVEVDVRVIAASHVDLVKAMENGHFRKDLFYRLNVVSLNLPSLAQRSEDIPILAMHFLKGLEQRYGSRVKGFSPDALEMLVNYSWPGNVRQLHNVVEQSVALSTTPLVPVTLIQLALREEARVMPSLREARNEFERDYLIRLLKMTRGNVSQAAKMAKRNRTEFYRLLNRHHLDSSLFKLS
ncbi:MAG: sigma 54-interacting transcriptional regulator [Gammaproteobacteria bacterium]